MTALDAAFALAEMDDVAVVIADHLHLDVPGVGNNLFDIDIVATECRLGLGPAAVIRLFQLGDAEDHAHASAAAAGDGLDHDRAGGAERGEEVAGLVQTGGAAGSLGNRDAATVGQRASRNLVAEQFQQFRARSHEYQARVGAGASESGVLAQESIARMHRVAAFFPGDRNHLTDIQIWRRARSGQGDRFIDASNMKGARIVLGIDANRPDPHFGRGASDADGNFAAVRDQERFYAHRRNSHPASTSLSVACRAGSARCRAYRRGEHPARRPRAPLHSK